ncbi:putative F0F1-ATPase subunit (Ca2+/Mg2+ transporter) [Geothermobacter ehrlichii]|uniref:Putative F0F1-ATPase subunit (Ca2+/Mg2+ transporter) n=1 Tax=Geothermobacter ehrlichii TaxID=213224 RepID=A0A5D3WHJ4_9BACT|nr:AtpZ/AtpI family protein [Geothermobacter ehrlichii]TYO95832.1 putative F0F1-ATPase subunit (Ca2+/Mg2+ transporter) [Geothermobacter ehrlichii]
MGEDRRQLIRSLGFLSGVGISLVAACMIGLAIGYYLDRWLQTSPWMTLVWLGIGIVAGFRNVFILTQRELRRQKKSENDDQRHQDP